jgi:hypothetical protein
MRLAHRFDVAAWPPRQRTLRFSDQLKVEKMAPDESEEPMRSADSPKSLWPGATPIHEPFANLGAHATSK